MGARDDTRPERLSGRDPSEVLADVDLLPWPDHHGLIEQEGHAQVCQVHPLSRLAGVRAPQAAMPGLAVPQGLMASRKDDRPSLRSQDCAGAEQRPHTQGNEHRTDLHRWVPSPSNPTPSSASSQRGHVAGSWPASPVVEQGGIRPPS